MSSVSASSQLCCTSKVAARTPVLAVRAQRQTRRSRQLTVASGVRKEAVTAAVVTTIGASLANPLVANAAVTPTLKNLVSSVVAGGVVLALIAGAITAVANFDPVRR